MLNDEFNNVFEKYDRYMANRTSEQAAAGGESTANLIEIEDRSLSQQLSALQTHDAVSSHDNKKSVRY